MYQRIFFILMSSLILFSCDNESSTNVDEFLIGNDWKISLYTDRSKIETDDYTDYVFNFEQTGKIVASEKGDTFIGTWTEGSDDSKSKLILVFENPYELEEISDDWQILSKNSNKIELYHKSGGDGHESYLTFEKK